MSYAERDIVKRVMPAVVQVVALKKQYRGNYAAAWTGSGTLVHPQGVVLTNCHVANPRAMGMPAPPADLLGIAITDRSDQPPALSYIVEIVAQSPRLDLAVLRVTRDVNGRAVKKLALPWVPIGNSDELELGDIISIFGYPGIGGETITFTSGSISGFTQQRDVTSGRAWIKTDATIAGGNSGGTAVSQHGYLVGIPTQAAAGTGISPVDARPVVDTNRDGRIDERDTPMAIGGFINGLRPVNLALPLLAKAGVRQAKSPSSSKPAKPTAKPGTLPSLKPGTSVGRGAKFTGLVFSQQVTQDGRPVSPGVLFPAGSKQIFASFNFSGMRKGTQWGQVWALDGKQIHADEGKWEDGGSGRKTIALGSSQTMPAGTYRLILTIRKQVAAEGEVTIGQQAADSDTQVSGRVIDRGTQRGIADALVIALKPGVRTADFVRQQKRDMAFTSVRTDKLGRFTFPKQLPKGQSYGMVVVARGYRDMAIDSALRISANAPETANIYPVPMIAD